MGKKYIPIVMGSCNYKVWIDNINRVFKHSKKITPPIPAFAKAKVSRKDSLETQQDEETSPHQIPTTVLEV